VSDGSIPIRDLALEYVKSTLSAVPIKADGSKSPVGSWKKFQEHLPSPYDIKQSFKGNVGIAILGGKVSGNLEIIDFDHPDLADPWISRVEENVAGLTAKLTRIKTPRGGAHFYYRCPEIEGNQKLAQEPTVDSTTGKPGAKVLIETRGEGGYVLAPGCPAACHPTGKIYEYVSGPELTKIQTITPEERKVLLDSARSFNRIPKQVKVHAPSGKKSGKGGLRPGDDFNMRATWEEVLTPHGWKSIKKQGEATHWCRPGKDDSTTSATTGHCGDNFYVFSSNASPFEPDTAYSKFSAYTVLAHNGDFEAAAKDLGGKGYGTKSEKKVREKKEREETDKYFDGREFLPEILAAEIGLKHTLISTPIGDDGLGVRIYTYRNGAFRPGGESIIVDEAYIALGRRTKENRVKDVVKNIRISKKIEYPSLNKVSKDLINVRNGMLDWRTETLTPHDPKHLSTIQISADYDPDAKSDLLDKFLEAVLPADEIPVIEEFIGYLLIPDTSFNKCLVVIGEGGNGKTTLMDLIMGFLGEENISHYSLQHISEEKFSVAGLFGSLANFYDELQTKQIKDTSTFKIVTGGSPLKAEDKGKAPFSFRPFCRLIFSANEMPRADDRSQAYFDRFIFIQLPNRIRGTRAEIREYAKVLLETKGVRSALLKRAVAGLQRLTKQGRFSASTSSLGAIEEYRRECNSAYDFIKEYCTFEDPTGWISKRDLYSRYKVWCIESTRKAMSSRGFSKGLEAMNVRSPRRGEGMGWGGISWAKDGPPISNVDEVNALNAHDDDKTSKGTGDLDF